MSSTNPEVVGVVHLEFLENGLALLRLGSSSERVITLTIERMRSLRAAIENVKAKNPRGLIITGSGPEMFTAGADINIIKNATSAPEASAMAREGQEVFGLIEALPFPTVAAISGPCVGGGCEMVLACRYRLISDHKSSVIGLPEIKLGILPGFGGTQRLPKVVGLPKALDIILAGKTLRPKQALSCGLVNEVVSIDALKTRAEQIALGQVAPRVVRPPLMDRLLSSTKLGRSLVKKKAAKSLQKETRGFYPAPLSALSATLLGLEEGMSVGLKFEAQELGRLIVTPESKSLVRLYFLTEASKTLGKPGRKATEHLRSVVVGAGVMGAGIAGSLARNDCSVILKDTSDDAVARGMTQIRNYFSKMSYLSETERSFMLNRIEPTSRDSANIGNAHFAIEAIFENMEVKKKVLSDLSKLLPADAIIASNTSSLSITEIAASIEHPERVIGMHFFNPVEKMPLVEIVCGKNTGNKTIAVVAALATKLGKFPIVVEDVPGFLVNRILAPYVSEAAHLLADGYSVRDIDEAALEFGMPMGPLRLLDEVGLDVAEHVSEIMTKGYGARMQAPQYVNKLVQAGRKGKKSGGGFYDFSEKGSSPHPGIRELLGVAKPPITAANRKDIADRLILRLINEAVQCLDEGVAGAPGAEAANQVDLGTVMGIGFPPFRGGVLYYAEKLGARSVAESLTRLAQKHGERFTPWTGIVKRAETNGSFLGAA